jgi:hypothetical protein
LLCNCFNELTVSSVLAQALHSKAWTVLHCECKSNKYMSLSLSLTGELPPCTSKPSAVAQAANQPLGVGSTELEWSSRLCHPPVTVLSSCSNAKWVTAKKHA